MVKKLSALVGPRFRYRVRNSPLDRVLSHMNQIHNLNKTKYFINGIQILS
jgi:hypothetical protein